MLTMHLPRLSACGATDVGQQRERNEDRFFCDPDRGIFLVIDGVGGHAAGEVAAEMACFIISQHLLERGEPASVRLREAITAANNELYWASEAQTEYVGMACVLTAVVIEEGVVTVGHVGDTRLYEVCKDGLRKITRDHSPVGAREDSGALTEVEAMQHPRRSEILRDVGSAPHAPGDEHFIDLYQFAWMPDNSLLLCSDGLTDLVTRNGIHQVLLDHAGRPEQAVETLIELANEMGGTDNITAVLVEGPAFATSVCMAEPAETFATLIEEQPASVPERRTVPRHWLFFLAGLLGGFLGAVWPLVGVVQWMDERVPVLEVLPPGEQAPAAVMDSTEVFRNAQPADE